MSDRLGRGEHFLRFFEPLDVIDVGVRGDEVFAVSQGEVHLADHVDDFGHGVLVADIDQHPVGFGEHQINAASQAAPRLDVHFDDVGEDLTPGQHRYGLRNLPELPASGEFCRDGLASKASDGALNRNVDRGHSRPPHLPKQALPAGRVTGIAAGPTNDDEGERGPDQPGKGKP